MDILSVDSVRWRLFGPEILKIDNIFLLDLRPSFARQKNKKDIATRTLGFGL